MANKFTLITPKNIFTIFDRISKALKNHTQISTVNLYTPSYSEAKRLLVEYKDEWNGVKILPKYTLSESMFVLGGVNLCSVKTMFRLDEPGEVRDLSTICISIPTGRINQIIKCGDRIKINRDRIFLHRAPDEFFLRENRYFEVWVLGSEETICPPASYFERLRMNEVYEKKYMAELEEEQDQEFWDQLEEEFEFED